MDIAPLLYRNTMIEVKRRFLAIDRVLGAKKPRTLNEEFDGEFMWLQLRKIVELVAFGGIMADEQRYAALRAEAKDNCNHPALPADSPRRAAPVGGRDQELRHW